jgi:hypothetical protein
MTREDLALIRVEAEAQQSRQMRLERLVSAAKQTSARASMLGRANVSNQLRVELKQVETDALYLFRQLEAMSEEIRPQTVYWNTNLAFAIREYNENAAQNREN